MSSSRRIAVATFLAAVALARPAFAEDEAPLPPVADPMLAPPAEAPVTVSSWGDALTRVRARSPEYAISMKSIERAEAQTRIALAS